MITSLARSKAIRKQWFGFIKQRVSSTEDAEDILREIFFQLAGYTRLIEPVTGWQCKVARNRITGNYSKQKLPLAEDMFSLKETEEDMMDWKEFLLPADSNSETTYPRKLFREVVKQDFI